MPQVSEKVIESYLRGKCQAADALCLKFASGTRGAPDRVVIYKGAVHFIELKKPGLDVVKGGLQEYFRKKLLQHGATYHLINSKEGVDQFVKELKRHS
ncbi:MAG: VRR-NUC domain-containing protein [Chloroflexi bacterium]|nr:MAG: VRR-NUC domain-containing protein [Chloroflexota bacterium]